MAIRLPRFLYERPIVTEKRTPELSFHQWWDAVVKQIESSFERIELALAAAGIALDNIGVFPSFSVRQTATSETLTASDYLVLVDANSAAVTVTLPTAASKEGSQIIVKKIDASVNAVTVEGDAAETIDGAANQSLIAQYDSITIASDGIEWWVI